MLGSSIDGQTTLIILVQSEARIHPVQVTDPSQGSHTPFIPMAHINSPVSLTSMPLDSRKKLEYPEEPHMDLGRPEQTPLNKQRVTIYVQTGSIFVSFLNYCSLFSPAPPSTSAFSKRGCCTIPIFSSMTSCAPATGIAVTAVAADRDACSFRPLPLAWDSVRPTAGERPCAPASFIMQHLYHFPASLWGGVGGLRA